MISRGPAEKSVAKCIRLEHNETMRKNLNENKVDLVPRQYGAFTYLATLPVLHRSLLSQAASNRAAVCYISSKRMRAFCFLSRIPARFIFC